MLIRKGNRIINMDNVSEIVKCDEISLKFYMNFTCDDRIVDCYMTFGSEEETEDMFDYIMESYDLNKKCIDLGD